MSHIDETDFENFKSAFMALEDEIGFLQDIVDILAQGCFERPPVYLVRRFGIHVAALRCGYYKAFAAMKDV